MRIRTLLRLAATGAAGWAVGVSGVEDNPRFAVLLLVVAAVCFLAAENYGWVRLLHQRWGWRFSAGVVVFVAIAVSVGAYLAVRYRTTGGDAVDTEARNQAEQAQREIADLRAEVGTLHGQVKAALDFQKAAKEAQEAKDRADAAERQRQSELEAERTGKIHEAIRVADAMRNEWNKYLLKAANVCRKDQIGTMDAEFSDLSRKTRQALTSAGYQEYVADFTDRSRCTGDHIPTKCLQGGGFNPEATAFFGSARCRISNLGAIIDHLRARQ